MPDQTPKPLYVALAQGIGAYHRCCGPTANASQASWANKHRDRIESLVKEHMPSGSGFDNGTTLDLQASTENKLVFTTAFHHMDDSGGYDGWTDHKITVRPSLAFAIDLTISGRDRNDIKEMMHETFDLALKTDVLEYAVRTPPESPETQAAGGGETQTAPASMDGFTQREFTDHTLAAFLREHKAIDNCWKQWNSNQWSTPDNRVLVIAVYSGQGGMDVKYWVRDPL